MWRSIRFPKSKSKITSNCVKRLPDRHYNTSNSSSSNSGKFLVSVVAAVGAGFTGAVVYGKYDDKFKKVLKENVPYIDYIYKYLDEKPTTVPMKTPSDEKKLKDLPITSKSGLFKQKLDHEKTASEVIPAESKTKGSTDPNIFESNVKKSETRSTEQHVGSQETQVIKLASNENLLLDHIKKVQKSSDEAKIAYSTAVKAVKQHTQTLYEALDLPEGKIGDIVWKDVTKANSDKNTALKFAEEKASQTKELMEKLKIHLKLVAEQGDTKTSVVQTAEESLQKVKEQLQDASAEITSVESESKTAEEYQKLIETSKEQFRRELQIVLPNYVYGDKDKSSENDLNLLIAHAHRRIDQLQKKLAKQQVTEKIRVDEAVHLQKVRDDQLVESKLEAELGKRHIDLESAISERVASLKENFENELRQQLLRQAAAHADHIQEVLKVQEQELERKYSLDLEEKLLHQKGVFISEVSGNMARLKGILAFLKARSEFDKASKKTQALWLACQSMSYKITADNGGDPYPLGKDIAALRIATDEENEFINTVISSIPAEAVNRGVYNNEVLKERFHDVKKICRRVALIDEKHDSLYRYILSYIQSFLIIDAVSIPQPELDGKVAVDPTEWDTFDILSRVSYCLKMNDLEQALRYANTLRGESKVVARDWMHEVRLLLETQLAVKALLAHAAAVGVQAYH